MEQTTNSVVVRNKNNFSIENILSKPSVVVERNNKIEFQVNEVNNQYYESENDQEIKEVETHSSKHDDSDASDNGLEFSDNCKKNSSKRPRTAFSASQIKSLEAEFEKNKYLSVAKRTSLSKTLNLSETQIKIWFQNRRTKWKRKYTSDVEQLASHYYANLGIGGLARPMVIGDRLWLFSQNPQGQPTIIPRTFPPTFTGLYQQRNLGYSSTPFLNKSVFPNQYPPDPMNCSKLIPENYSQAIDHKKMAFIPPATGLADLERAFGSNSSILNERRSDARSNSSSEIDCEEFNEVS